VDSAELTAPDHRGPALWAFIFAGPALRTSLLGALLVAEQEIGEAFGLGAGALALLVECIIFGGLIAIVLLPVSAAAIGSRRVSMVASTVCVAGLAAGMILAPHLSAGAAGIAVLFAAATLIGVFAAILSPITQTLLNRPTTGCPEVRHIMQSVWSAGAPAGFIGASLLGGILVERIEWWAALAVPLAFASVAALSLFDRSIARTVEAKGTQLPATKEVGVILLALVAFEIWSTWGSVTSWIAPGTLMALFIAAGLGILAFHQLRHSPRPLISLAPFGNSSFAAATLVLLIYQFPTTAEFEVLLLTELDHFSAEAIGDRTAIGNIAQFCGTAVSAGLMHQRRVRLALGAGFVLTIVGLAGYILYPWWDSFGYAAATRLAVGLGSGLLTPVLFVLALDRMPAPLQLAAGTWLVLAMIGGTEIGLAIFDVVLDFTAHVSNAALTGYVAVEISQLAIGLATGLLALLLASRQALCVTICRSPPREW
jgi:MFS family permease